MAVANFLFGGAQAQTVTPTLGVYSGVLLIILGRIVCKSFLAHNSSCEAYSRWLVKFVAMANVKQSKLCCDGQCETAFGIALGQPTPRKAGSERAKGERE